MVCFNLRPSQPEEIDPISSYLQRRGWNESLLPLLKCSKSEVQTFVPDEEDPNKIVMLPIEQPTHLFQKLQRRQWGEALDALRADPSQARVWIFRESEFPESQMLWKLLPLHGAIAMGAPSYLILELISAYPEAAAKFDMHRSLPVHLAASRIDVDEDGERVLSALLRAFPESASVENERGKIPIELAYGAQLRKDKENAIRSWCVAAAGEGERGFELQLEMRDVMESYNDNLGGNERADPSAWSLGTDPTTSSFSSKSVNLDTYSFLSRTKSKLGTIRESHPSDSVRSPANSSECESESTGDDATKSIAFRSIDVMEDDVQQSFSSIGLISNSESFSSRSGFSFGRSHSSSGRFMNPLYLRKMRSRGSGEGKSLSLSASQSFSVKSSPGLLQKSRSRSVSIGNQNSIDVDSVAKQVSFADDDCRENSSLRSNRHVAKDGGVIIGKARSFALPSQKQQVMRARSMPSALKLSKFRSGDAKEKQMIVDSKRAETAEEKQMYDDSRRAETVKKESPSEPSEPDKQKAHRHTRYFDLTQKQSMYSSPARSLPLKMKSRFRSLEAKRQCGDGNPTLGSSSSLEKSCDQFDSVASNDGSAGHTDSPMIVLDESMVSLEEQHGKQQDCLRQARSFDVRTKEKTYTSPKSMPSVPRGLKAHSQSMEEQSINGNNPFGEYPSDATSSMQESSESTTSLEPVNDSASASSESSGEQNRLRHAHSFDRRTKQIVHSSHARSLSASNMMPASRCQAIENKKVSTTGNVYVRPKQKMYSSPARSMPTAVPMSKPRSRSTGTQTESIDSNKCMSVSSDTSFPEPAQQQLEESTYVISEPSNSEPAEQLLKQRGWRHARSFDFPSKQSLYPCPAKFLPISYMENDINPSFERDIANQSFTDLTENESTEAAESIEFECSLDGVVTFNTDQGSQSDDISSSESASVYSQDPVLIDFIEEAVSNIGREKTNIELVLREFHSQHIDKIDDLLKANSKDFASSLSDKVLAREMKRLLDESEFESETSLRSIYDDDCFLRGSVSSGGSASRSAESYPLSKARSDPLRAGSFPLL